MWRYDGGSGRQQVEVRGCGATTGAVAGSRWRYAGVVVRRGQCPLHDASRHWRTDSAVAVLRQYESDVGRPQTAAAGDDVTGRSRDTSATSGNPWRCA